MLPQLKIIISAEGMVMNSVKDIVEHVQLISAVART